MSNGNSTSQFPAAVYLSNYTSHSYVPYPYGNAGATTITSAALSTRIVPTIYGGNGVVCCGQSAPSGSTSHLPGYPEWNVGHWIVVRGYEDNGAFYNIADPAKSSAVSWSGNISAYYRISGTKLAAFASNRGIIY